MKTTKTTTTKRNGENMFAVSRGGDNQWPAAAAAVAAAATAGWHVNVGGAWDSEVQPTPRSCWPLLLGAWLFLSLLLFAWQWPLCGRPADAGCVLMCGL